MIAEIANKMIRVEPFGLQPGLYNADNLCIEFLVRERNLLHAKLFEQNDMEKKEVDATYDLIKQITDIIVEKCEVNNP